MRRYCYNIHSPCPSSLNPLPYYNNTKILKRKQFMASESSWISHICVSS